MSKRLCLILSALVMLASWAEAQGGVRIRLGIGLPLFRPCFGVRAYVAPPPVFLAPPPVYVVPAQAPVYVQQAPAIYQPPPPRAIYPPPASLPAVPQPAPAICIGR